MAQIEQTKDISEALRELVADKFPNVRVAAASNLKQLFMDAVEQAIHPPVAWVVYAGSDYGNKPVRDARYLIVVAQDLRSLGTDEILGNLDAIVQALDKRVILGNAFSRVESDSPVYVEELAQWHIWSIEIQVEDH